MADKKYFIIMFNSYVVDIQSFLIITIMLNWFLIIDLRFKNAFQ